MAGGRRKGSRCPRFLRPLGTALRLGRAPGRSWDVSPPGQDQATNPAWAGSVLGALGRLLHTLKDGAGGRQGSVTSGTVGVISRFTSLGSFVEGSGKIWAMTHILSRNMAWTWIASPSPAIPDLYCTISPAQSSPRAWPATICAYVWIFHEPREKQIKPKVTLEGGICH